MQEFSPPDVVFRASRFVTLRSEIDRLLPGFSAALPPLRAVEFAEGAPRSVIGWALRPSPALTRELFRLVVGEIGRAIADGGTRPTLPPAAVLLAEPYFLALDPLLARCRAHGPEQRIDGVLWLHLCDLVARLLNRDEELLRELRLVIPADLDKGAPYLDELLRLKGSNPARHGAVKVAVLAAISARHDLAVGAVAEVGGQSAEHGLLRHLVASRLAFTEAPDGLYAFFDLREAFTIRERRIDLEAFSLLSRFVQAVVAEAHRRRGDADLAPAERWLLGRYAGDALLERAGRGELSRSAVTVEGDLSLRVATLAALQPDLCEYVLHHATQFPLRKAALKQFDLEREAPKLLKDPAALAERAQGYREVVEDVLRWDVLNAARGLVQTVRAAGDGLAIGGRPIRASSPVIDLASPGTVVTGRRHLSAVALRLSGFEAELSARLSDAEDRTLDEDLTAECLRRVFAARDAATAGGGRNDGFDDGWGLDIFPRAIDALRYAVGLQADLRAARTVRLGASDGPRTNPLARAPRIGIASAEVIDVTIPSAGTRGLLRAFGPARREARELVDQPDVPSFDGRVALDEYDPLELFRATVLDGVLENRGLCLRERTYREIVLAVRLEGLDHATPERKAVIAGRAVEWKSYRFELVFDDPVSRRVLLFRRIAEAVRTTGGEHPVYEVLAMDVPEFVAFVDRSTELARSRPAPAPSRLPRSPVVEERVRGPGATPHRPEPLRATSGLSIPEVGSVSLGMGPGATRDVLGGRLGLTEQADPRPSRPAADQSFLGGLLGAEDAGTLDGDWEKRLAGGSAVSEDAGPFSFGDPDAPDEFEPLESSVEPLEPLFDFERDTPFELPKSGGAPGLSARPAPARASAAPVGASLLGSVGRDLLDRLAARATAREIAAQGPRRAPSVTAARVPTSPTSPTPSSPPTPPSPLTPPSPPTPPTPSLAIAPPSPPRERLAVPRPDFAGLFRDYVIFPVRDGSGGFVIGRRYREVLFDLHRFLPEGEEPLDRDGVIESFMRGKLRDNFVPRSLSYEEIPASAGPVEPLTVERLDRAFARIS